MIVGAYIGVEHVLATAGVGGVMLMVIYNATTD